MNYHSIRFKWCAGIIWLLLCIWSLHSFVTHERAWVDAELMHLAYLKMIVLTFPTGYLAALVVGYFLELFVQLILDIRIGVEYEFYLNYFFMLSLGFWQWFVALHWLVRKFMARQK
jgi:hypothetical protein